ncbi:MAG: hypothetical protein J6P02_05545 [Lachnospiraceae bacterium]|nr:hypothetical protein [Lachnospiraceae bacterium]
MKKKVLALSLILAMVFTANVFAYRWIEEGNDWYVLNEDSGEYLKSKLLDVGDNVYYLDKDGKLVTGWWKNPTTKKYYFFDNKIDRNYGGMVFGLHMIDGYYYFFGDDGSLQTSDAKGTYKKVYQEYYADSDGYLYYDNTLMRDVSIAKSEFYTNPAYYTNVNLNNYYLANFDKVGTAKELDTETKSEINASQANEAGKKTSASTTTGGTYYDVDENGRIHTYNDVFETSEAEKYGPMKKD